MAQVLKDALPHGRSPADEVGTTVREMLAEIERGGLSAVRRYSEQLDGWSPESFEVGADELESLCGQVPDELRGWIDEAAERVTTFASAQLESLRPLELESSPGVVVGHRLVPVASVGAYVPGGHYQLIAGALMSVATARVAGVPRVIVATPPGPEGQISPATAYAARIAGADAIYAVGGVQALAAMAYGLLPGEERVAMLVGPGNAFVAEAKRQLFGTVGIDLLAGPTEIAVIADETARPSLVAIDLISQAEHGPTSPARLITTSEPLAREVLSEVDRLLPEAANTAIASAAWESYGSVIVADDDEEVAILSDEFAPEHLELHVANPEWFHDRLTNYGSVFIGEETTVTFGDKVSGPNHTLPTLHGATYTGGLWAGSFIKVLSYQRLTREGAASIAPAAEGISNAERLYGHADSAAARLDLERFPHLGANDPVS